MDHTADLEVRLAITSPPGAADSPDFSPFEWPDADGLVFVVFARDEDQRAQLLRALRDAAAHAARDGVDAADAAARYAHAVTGRSGADALSEVVRWRAGALRAPFHTYNLRVACPPYRTCCLIAFQELATAELRANVDRALRVIENSKERMLDAFGLAHYLHPPSE